MPLLPYDYLHLVNCPEVVIISDILCIMVLRIAGGGKGGEGEENRVIDLRGFAAGKK